jgi:hypothetical protein
MLKDFTESTDVVEESLTLINEILANYTCLHLMHLSKLHEPKKAEKVLLWLLKK